MYFSSPLVIGPVNRWGTLLINFPLRPSTSWNTLRPIDNNFSRPLCIALSCNLWCEAFAPTGQLSFYDSDGGFANWQLSFFCCSSTEYVGGILISVETPGFVPIGCLRRGPLTSLASCCRCGLRCWQRAYRHGNCELPSSAAGCAALKRVAFKPSSGVWRGVLLCSQRRSEFNRGNFVPAIQNSFSMCFAKRFTECLLDSTSSHRTGKRSDHSKEKEPRLFLQTEVM